MGVGTGGDATGICGLTTIAPACSAPLPSDPVGLRVATFGSQMAGRGSITPRQGGVRASGKVGKAAKGREAAEQANAAALMTGAVGAGQPPREGHAALGQY